jgi:hypothetical protein
LFQSFGEILCPLHFPLNGRQRLGELSGQVFKLPPRSPSFRRFDVTSLAF